MPEIKLFELGPTRSSRVRWTLLKGLLGEADYLVDNRFSVTDIFVSYTVNWGEEDGLLSDYPNLHAYLERLFSREHCTLERH